MKNKFKDTLRSRCLPTASIYRLTTNHPLFYKQHSPDLLLFLDNNKPYTPGLTSLVPWSILGISLLLVRYGTFADPVLLMTPSQTEIPWMALDYT